MLVTAVAQFTTKMTYLKKAIQFLSLISYSLNKPKSHTRASPLGGLGGSNPPNNFEVAMRSGIFR